MLKSTPVKPCYQGQSFLALSRNSEVLKHCPLAPSICHPATEASAEQHPALCTPVHSLGSASGSLAHMLTCQWKRKLFSDCETSSMVPFTYCCCRCSQCRPALHMNLGRLAAAAAAAAIAAPLGSFHLAAALLKQLQLPGHALPCQQAIVTPPFSSAYAASSANSQPSMPWLAGAATM